MFQNIFIKLLYIPIISAFIAVLMPAVISAQVSVDSLISERNNKYQDYLRFRESLKKHSWTDLMKLKDQAGDILKTDNTLINEYFIKERLQLSKRESEIVKLKNEVNLAKKEIESKEAILKEHKNFTKMLFYALIAAGILVILFIAIFIDRQIRYRRLKDEIERIWANAGEYDNDLYKNEELAKEIRSLKKDKEKLLARIDELSQIDKDNNEQNSKLHNEIKRLNEKIKQLQTSAEEKDNMLKKEIEIRKAVEEEIKELIRRIK